LESEEREGRGRRPALEKGVVRREGGEGYPPS
jgi:hypothetical protein